MGRQRRKAGEQAYPTRRYPGTVLVFPLSRMSKTAVSAAPKGTSFTHMRFFLDTEASGSGGVGSKGVRRGKKQGRGPKMAPDHSPGCCLRELSIWRGAVVIS